MNVFFAIFACVLVAQITSTTGVRSLNSMRRLTCPPIKFPNGRVRYKQKSGFAQFTCSKTYILAGEKYMKCVHGQWEGDIPTCVRNTCKSISMPKNGFVYPSYRGGVLTFFCMANYELHGPQLVYCDGKKWSNYLPTCIDSKRNVSLSCDFEHEDLCGWSHDINHDFDWIRMKNSTPSWHVGTGPNYDHTYGTSAEGHYMYIEATSKKLNDTARLISPVYKKQKNNTCLEFFYHMYGSTMGELRVYLKKIKENWDLSPSDAYFVVSGNQGSVWRRSFIEFGPVDDDFQIIMEGVRGSSYLSDIAIDDIKIIENCEEEVEESTSITSTTINEAEEDLMYESCADRCGIKYANNSFCECDYSCFITKNCCPDYIALCLLTDFSEGGDLNENVTLESDSFETTESVNGIPTDTTEEETAPSATNEEFVSSPSTIIVKQNVTQSVLIPRQVSITTTKRPSTSKKPTTVSPNFTEITTLKKSTTTTPKKPTTTPKKITTTTPKKPTTTTTNNIVIVISKPNVKHIFNRTKPILFPKHIRIQNITKPPIILRPNYKKSYANNKSFRDKENDFFKNDMLTVAPTVNDDELLIATEVPKKLSSLLQLEHTDTNSTKDESSGIKTFIYVSVGLLCVGILLTIYVVKRRIACSRIKRIRNGSYGDSASDVRYLTSDEKLDFTLATPY